MLGRDELMEHMVNDLSSLFSDDDQKQSKNLHKLCFKKEIFNSRA